MNRQNNGTADNMGATTSNLPKGPIKRRAIVACRHCSLRKVRCDVSTSGLPCHNCARDDTTCEVVPRKKRRGRRATTARDVGTGAGSGEDSTPLQGYQYDALAVESMDQLGQQAVPASSPESKRNSSLPEAASVQAASVQAASVQAASVQVSNVESLSDEEENVNAYVQVLDPIPHSSKETSSGLFYFGGRQGLGGFMFDICEGPATPRNTHYMLPLSKKATIAPEEKMYLNSLGALDLPHKDVCNSLLRCYFRNVHQLLPVIDAQELLANYLDRGPESMSLLLLWSIFFASSNFVGSEILDTAGFRSRKIMKRYFYRRAKALYDCDYEKDKLALIQSVILLGLWYNDTNDRNGAWHWIGIAISLSQSIGLHRRLRLAAQSNPIPERREKLYRRIWWTCFVRDRWLSLASGQSMRIHLAECDVPAPSMSDITDEIEMMDPATRCEYIPWEPAALAQLWLRLVHISKALGSILDGHRNVNESKPGVAEIQSCEQEIALCSVNSAELEFTDPMMSLFASQLQLLHEATIVVLYRPYIFKGPAHPDEAVTKLWQKKSLDRARLAAANTTRVLERLLEANSIKRLKSMTITALIPAMQIHLLDCKSSNALVRQFAAQKLHVCMLALSELRDTYWGADFVFEMFQRAENKLLEASINSLHDKVPETATLQPEAAASTMQTMLLPSNSGAPSFNRPINTENGSDDTSNSYGVSNTTSSDGVDLDHSFQFLLDSNDFSNLFLDMVYN